MRAKEFSPRKLVIFDIDDTLVHTQTKVRVIRNGKVVKELNSHDFTHYKLQPGEEFDFENFRNAQEFFNNSKPIIPMMNQLKQDIATGNKVVMVTARADFDDRELFLDTFRKYGVDMGKVHVYRAGNMTQKVQTEEKKKIIIRNLLDKGNYTKAIMYDDAVPNLTSFVELKDEYANTKFYAWHVSLEGEATEFHRTNEQVQPNLNETVISEDAVMGKLEDSGKIIRILKKAHTVPFSDEKNWLLVDVDPAKGNKGLGLKWIPADTRFEWVRPYRDSIDENFANPAKAYRAHLIKTLPQIMKLFANIGKGWIPSKEQMLSAVDNAYQVMKHTGDAKQAGKVLMDELNTLYRMSKNKQDVAEGSEDLVQIEYWQQETMESGRWVKTKPIPRATAEKIVNSFERGEIVDVEQGGRKGQLAHWMANMKSGKAKNK